MQPRSREPIAFDPLPHARVIPGRVVVAERAGDLGARASTDTPAAATDALALGEEPGRQLADAVDRTRGMNDLQMFATRPLAVANGAITPLLSTFHDDLQPAPVRRARVLEAESIVFMRGL